jgi:fructose-1,6-bisphosphatase/inositol monophosphatase family enzyme
MRNQSVLKKEMGAKLRVKGSDNTTYAVDYVGGQVLDILLKRRQAAGKKESWAKFDEEDEKFTFFGEGGTRLKVITDPFDNTTLGMSGLRDCNVAICICDNENNFLACAVSDLQTDAVYMANREGSWLYFVKDHKIENAGRLKAGSRKDLSGANLVVPTFSQARRLAFGKTPLYNEKIQIFNMGGPLSISRLAEGSANEVHGYVDATEGYGQPIYEILYFPIAIQAGVIVTGMDGKPFNFGALVQELEKNPKARYQFVAACTPELHQALMAKAK